jgi:hypothetical protein
MLEYQVPPGNEPVVETNIKHIIAKVPALEVKLDTPTVEQIHVNDEVFQHTTSEADKVVGVIGMMSGMMLLHDVAVDTMYDVEDLEGHLKRAMKTAEEEEPQE